MHIKQTRYSYVYMILWVSIADKATTQPYQVDIIDKEDGRHAWKTEHQLGSYSHAQSSILKQVQKTSHEQKLDIGTVNRYRLRKHIAVQVVQVVQVRMNLHDRAASIHINVKCAYTHTCTHIHSEINRHTQSYLYSSENIILYKMKYW